MPSAPHILISEDYAAVRNLLTTIVARMYPTGTITPVATSIQALAAYDQHGADIVITNVKQPIMRGLALIQTLRDQQASLPILAISMDGSIAELVLAAGAT